MISRVFDSIRMLALLLGPGSDSERGRVPLHEAPQMLLPWSDELSTGDGSLPAAG